MKMESDLNDSGDAAGSELEARSEEFEDRSLGNRMGSRLNERSLASSYLLSVIS